MIASDVFAVVRDWLQDPLVGDDGTRYLNASLLRGLNQGIIELYGRQPDCVLENDDTVLVADRPASVQATDNEFGVNSKYLVPLAHAVCAHVYNLDTDEHIANAQGLAASHRKEFLQAIQ